MVRRHRTPRGPTSVLPARHNCLVERSLQQLGSKAEAFHCCSTESRLEHPWRCAAFDQQAGCPVCDNDSVEVLQPKFDLGSGSDKGGTRESTDRLARGDRARGAIASSAGMSAQGRQRRDQSRTGGRAKVTHRGRAGPQQPNPGYARTPLRQPAHRRQRRTRDARSILADANVRR